MLGPIRYAAANAVVRSRVAQLLSSEMWRELLEARSLQRYVAVLQGSSYAELLPAGEPPAEQLEQALLRHLARAYRAPARLLQGQPKELVLWRWRRFELDNLKIVLRAVARGEPERAIMPTLLDLGPASELPWRRLAAAQQVGQVVSRLAEVPGGRFYARALEPAVDRFETEGRLFVLEVALDLAYYRRLLRLVKGFSGRDGDEAERLVGRQIDAQNLLWAFRYRLFFGLSPEETLAYTLQRGLRIDANVVRRIALGAEIVAVVNEVWPWPLPGIEQIAEQPPRRALTTLELLFRRDARRQAEAALEGYPFHLGAILAYQTLLEHEVLDLITIAEAKMSGWQAERTRPLLIGERG